MGLSTDLISQFVKNTNDSEKKKEEIVVYGTIVNDGERNYVQIDGSSEMTPINATVETNAGDRVLVTIKNHTATITGNVTDPAVGTKRAGDIESSIKQTAESIRLEVKNEIDKLSASFEVTAEGISSWVTNKDRYTKILQDAEAITFVDDGGKVKIDGGSIKLTGSITFGDFNSDLQSTINTASNNASSASDEAETAKYNAELALTKAQNAYDAADAAFQLASNVKLPSYLTSTYIDQTTIMSPSIVGGTFYAVGQDSWTTMDSAGLHVYTDYVTKPKIELIYDETFGYVSLVLGVGTDTTGQRGRFYINKGTTATYMTYYSGTQYNTYCQLVFDNGGGITAMKCINGVESSINII